MRSKTARLTGHERKYEYTNGCVAEVEYGRHDTADVQFGREEVHTVGEQVDRRERRRQKRTPPPVVILQNDTCFNNYMHEKNYIP